MTTTFTSMQDALYRIQGAVTFVQKELDKGGPYDDDARGEIETALTSISEALGLALDAYTRLPLKRRPN